MTLPIAGHGKHMPPDHPVAGRQQMARKPRRALGRAGSLCPGARSTSRFEVFRIVERLVADGNDLNRIDIGEILYRQLAALLAVTPRQIRKHNVFADRWAIGDRGYEGAAAEFIYECLAGLGVDDWHVADRIAGDASAIDVGRHD